MTRPLRINATTPVSLIEMSDGEMDYIAHQILTEFGANTLGTGTVSMNPANTTGLTAIGTFVDTNVQQPVGTHPANTTILSTNYNFYQDLRAVSTAGAIRPVKYTPGTGVAEQTDSDINTHEIGRALARLVANGLGSYRLQGTTPVVGGTWVQVATITDSAQGGNAVTYLWRRTDQTAPTTFRPIEITAPSITEMSDADIKTLTNHFRNHIINSGIGQYKAQASAPGGGTWVTVGDASFIDTRENFTDISYSGNYGGSFSGSYSPTFSGSYRTTSTVGFNINYTGSFNTYRVNYRWTTTRSDTFYTIGGTFFVPYNTNFIGYFVGPTYNNFFAGTTFNTNYQGTEYTGTYTGVGSSAGSYGGTFTGNYTGATVQATKSNISQIALWIRTA